MAGTVYSSISGNQYPIPDVVGGPNGSGIVVFQTPQGANSPGNNTITINMDNLPKKNVVFYLSGAGGNGSQYSNGDLYSGAQGGGAGSVAFMNLIADWKVPPPPPPINTGFGAIRLPAWPSPLSESKLTGNWTFSINVASAGTNGATGGPNGTTSVAGTGNAFLTINGNSFNSTVTIQFNVTNGSTRRGSSSANGGSGYGYTIVSSYPDIKTMASSYGFTLNLLPNLGINSISGPNGGNNGIGGNAVLNTSFSAGNNTYTLCFGASGGDWDGAGGSNPNNPNSQLLSYLNATYYNTDRQTPKLNENGGYSNAGAGNGIGDGNPGGAALTAQFPSNSLPPQYIVAGGGGAGSRRGAGGLGGGGICVIQW